MRNILEGDARQFLDWVAEDLAQLVVDTQPAPIDADMGDPDGGLLEGDAVDLIAGEQGRGGLLGRHGLIQRLLEDARAPATGLGAPPEPVHPTRAAQQQQRDQRHPQRPLPQRGIDLARVLLGDQDPGCPRDPGGVAEHWVAGIVAGAAQDAGLIARGAGREQSRLVDRDPDGHGRRLARDDVQDALVLGSGQHGFAGLGGQRPAQQQREDLPLRGRAQIDGADDVGALRRDAFDGADHADADRLARLPVKVDQLGLVLPHRRAGLRPEFRLGGNPLTTKAFIARVVEERNRVIPLIAFHRGETCLTLRQCRPILSVSA